MRRNPFDTTTMLRPAERGHHAFDRRHADRAITHWLTWRHLRLKITTIDRWGGGDWTLLQIEVLASRDTPVPVTSTGYVARGITSDEIEAAGGPAAYVTRWLDEAASRRTYRDSEFRWRQGDLFDLIDDGDRSS